MFTAEQISEKLAEVRTGADFPSLAMRLRSLGVTYYETRMEDGSSIYHGANGYELATRPRYSPIAVADQVNPERLKAAVADHQQGKSDYLTISRQCARSGIEKWAVCLITMTCTYLDKTGNTVWVEQIPDLQKTKSVFTADQIKKAHSKVKSGADFPGYIREIKALGVTHYETCVADGHIEYHGANGYAVQIPARHAPLAIAGTARTGEFKTELLAHQQGKTDFPTFIRMCATVGVEKWMVNIEKMTCTYYDASGNEILTEEIPQ